MTIKPGDRLPQATLRMMTADGPAAKTTEDLFGGRKVVLFGVPGAFTPTCHNNHMVGFLAKADDILATGVEAIAVVAVNDVFVMNAWAKATGADGKIEFLSDGNGDLAAAMGLTLDGSGFGLGTRFQRFSMVLNDGVVESLNIEDGPGKAEISGADAMLRQLQGV